MWLQASSNTVLKRHTTTKHKHISLTPEKVRSLDTEDSPKLIIHSENGLNPWLITWSQSHTMNLLRIFTHQNSHSLQSLGLILNMVPFVTFRALSAFKLCTVFSCKSTYYTRRNQPFTATFTHAPLVSDTYQRTRWATDCGWEKDWSSLIYIYMLYFVLLMAS